MKTEMLTPGDTMWPDATRLIARTYRQAYGAELQAFPPRIMAATGRDGDIICAAGMRVSEDGFFSDIYLDQGCASAIASAAAEPVADSDVIEVVNMASKSRYAALPLLDAVTAAGRDMGKRWGVFTATAHLRRLLTRAGLPLVLLAPARAERCADPSMWGSYYASDPWVCALKDAASARLSFSPRPPVLPDPGSLLRAG